MRARGMGPAPASLWRNHDYVVLWTGETVSALGSSMSFLVFPLVGLALTGSAFQAALAGTAFAAGGVVTKLPAGVLVDRWDRRRVMVVANTVGAVLYASLGLALLLGVLTLGHLVAVALATGVAASFFGPAETAALREVVPREQLPTAFSQNQARQHVAGLVGPPLGGALYGLVRWLPFLVDGVTFALSALAVTRIRTPLGAPDTTGDRRRWRTDITEGIRFLLSRGFFRAFLAFAALANFSTQALFLVLVLKLASAGVAPAAIGLIETMGAVAGICGSVLAPWVIRRVPSGLLSIVAGLVLAAAVVPMGFTDDPIAIGGLLALALVLNPAGNASTSAYVTAITPDRLQGRVGAALVFCATAVTPLGPLVGGVLLHLLGSRDAMLVAAGMTALAVVPLLLSSEVRRLPTPDRWPDTTALEPVGILEG